MRGTCKRLARGERDTREGLKKVMQGNEKYEEKEEKWRGRKGSGRVRRGKEWKGEEGEE